MRLLCGMDEVLMSHPRGLGKTPGELRCSQVWIGGTRPGSAVFVPPPTDALADCLTHFERFLNDVPEPTPPLIKAALAHVQFETIQEFLDGNGRLGRLLIVLQLVSDGVLRTPMLYPSLYFKTHRASYYDLLDGVRRHGDWERWRDFFAEGVQVGASQAAATANALLALVTADRDRIAGLGRAAPSAHAVHQAMQRQPLATSATLVKATRLTPATVDKSLAHLERLAIVAELTNRKRDRVFGYRRYVDELTAELESRREPGSFPPECVGSWFRGRAARRRRTCRPASSGSAPMSDAFLLLDEPEGGRFSPSSMPPAARTPLSNAKPPPCARHSSPPLAALASLEARSRHIVERMEHYTGTAIDRKQG